MKPTQKNLSEYIGMTAVGLSKMKKERPKVFELLWNGWVQKCKN
jgi:hypothetical protein